MAPDLRFHIFSYPRSGNHLVRTLVEYATQRPTEGCTKRDKPIHARQANDGILKIQQDVPVGYKAHYLDQLLKRRWELGENQEYIFITRDPLRAISSQVTRQANRKLLVTQRWLRRTVEHNLRDYLALIYFFKSLDEDKKLHLSFEELISDDVDSSLWEMRRLFRFIGCPDIELDADVSAKILALSKDSQNSLRRGNPTLQSRIESILQDCCPHIESVLLDLGSSDHRAVISMKDYVEQRTQKGRLAA